MCTSIYLVPMWCLCLCSAKSLCSSLSNRTSASPFLLPWAFRHNAAPPLHTQTHACSHSLETLALCRLNDYNLLISGACGWFAGYVCILGDVETPEESGDVLVWGLPWKTPCSDHCVIIHPLHLTTIHIHTCNLNNVPHQLILVARQQLISSDPLLSSTSLVTTILSFTEILIGFNKRFPWPAWFPVNVLWLELSDVFL